MIGQAIIESRKSLGGEYQWWTSAWNGEIWAPTNTEFAQLQISNVWTNKWYPSIWWWEGLYPSSWPPACKFLAPSHFNHCGHFQRAYWWDIMKVGSGRMLVPAYRALGWTGSSGPDAVCDLLDLLWFTISIFDQYFLKLYSYNFTQARKAKDLMHMKRMQNRHWQQLGVKANKLRGNTHFRDRNGMCWPVFNVQGDSVSLHIFLG